MRSAGLRAAAKAGRCKPATTIIGIVRGTQPRRLLKDDTAQGVECGGDAAPGGRTLNEGARRRSVGIGIGSAIDGVDFRQGEQTEGIIGVGQRGRACRGQRGAQAGRRGHDQRTGDRRQHPPARVGAQNRFRQRAVDIPSNCAPIVAACRHGCQPSRRCIDPPLDAVRQAVNAVGRRPAQRAAHADGERLVGLDATQRLEAARRIGLACQTTKRVVAEGVCVVTRVGEVRQQSIRGIGELHGLVGRVGDRRQIPIAVQA